MNGEQPKSVFMKMQIIQARLAALGLLLLNTYAETEIAATDFWQKKKLNVTDNFSYVFGVFGNSDLL